MLKFGIKSFSTIMKFCLLNQNGLYSFEQKAATCLSSAVGFFSIGELALTDGLCSFVFFHEGFSVLCVVLTFHQKMS